MSFLGDFFDFNGDQEITGFEWLCDFTAFYVLIYALYQRYYKRKQEKAYQLVYENYSEYDEYDEDDEYEYLCFDDDPYDEEDLDRKIREE